MQISMSQSNHRLIHVGEYHINGNGKKRLFLREVNPHHFTWFEENGTAEQETEVEAPSIEEALRIARRTWKNHAFRTLNCGFRYTLPERDEHGMNALFFQLANSQRSPNGIYFDEELGHNCFVQNASNEAIDLFKKLEETKRL